MALSTYLNRIRDVDKPQPGPPPAQQGMVATQEGEAPAQRIQTYDKLSRTDHCRFWYVNSFLFPLANQNDLKDEYKLLKTQENKLDERIDTCDRVIIGTQLLAAFLVGVLQIIKNAIEIKEQDSQQSSASVKIIMDCIIAVIPIVTTLIAGIAKMFRDNALDYKEKIIKSQHTLNP